jgi:hypothetical protein
MSINVDPGTYVINERTLTDDTLTVAPEGEPLPGGFAAEVTFHTFASAWSDNATTLPFVTLDEAEAWIIKRYGKTPDELIYDTDEEDQS